VATHRRFLQLHTQLALIFRYAQTTALSLASSNPQCYTVPWLAYPLSREECSDFALGKGWIKSLVCSIYVLLAEQAIHV